MEQKPELQKLVRNFVIELVVYGVLLIIYFYTILRLLSDVLNNFYENNLVIYAVLALVLIIAQGVLLESLTSFLIKLLRLEK